MAKSVALAAFEAELKALDPKALAELVETRHPEYKEYEDHWEFMHSCYEGGREWFKENIFKYLREGDREYDDRVKRAYRFNHTREVVDLVNKYIFKAGVNRREADAPETVKRFWKSTTLRRRGINEFMKLLAQNTSIYGKVWVVVDSSMPGDVKTVAEAKRIGARTYAYIIPPTDALDASFSKDGELNWLFVREHVRDDASFTTSNRKKECRYRLWTKQFWAVIVHDGKDAAGKDKYKVSEVGEHNLGRVPAFPADHIIDQDEMTATSLIDDVAYLDRSAANYLSNLDAIIQDQTFSQLIIPAQGMMPGEDDHSKLLEMGTKRILTFDAQANMSPEYISADPKQAGVILQVIEKIISEIYHTVGMAGERTKQDNSMGIDNSSGVAKAYDFDRMNAMLASKANALQFAENELVALVLAWNSETPPEKDLVSYPQNFDVRSLYDEFEIAQKLALVAAPKMVRREQMKITAEKLFPRLSESELKEMKSEIDSDWPEDPVLTPAGGSKLPSPKPTKENSSGQNNNGTKSV
jgi:hypothetical protein